MANNYKHQIGDSVIAWQKNFTVEARRLKRGIEQYKLNGLTGWYDGGWIVPEKIEKILPPVVETPKPLFAVGDVLTGGKATKMQLRITDRHWNTMDDFNGKPTWQYKYIVIEYGEEAPETSIWVSEKYFTGWEKKPATDVVETLSDAKLQIGDVFHYRGYRTSFTVTDIKVSKDNVRKYKIDSSTVGDLGWYEEDHMNDIIMGLPPVKKAEEEAKPKYKLQIGDVFHYSDDESDDRDHTVTDREVEKGIEKYRISTVKFGDIGWHRYDDIIHEFFAMGKAPVKKPLFEIDDWIMHPLTKSKRRVISRTTKVNGGNYEYYLTNTVGWISENTIRDWVKTTEPEKADEPKATKPEKKEWKFKFIPLMIDMGGHWKVEYLKPDESVWQTARGRDGLYLIFPHITACKDFAAHISREPIEWTVTV